MYPEGTQVVYSTWTPRGSRIPGVDKVVSFGQMAMLKKIHEIFKQYFFWVDIDVVLQQYIEFIAATLGDKNPDTTHIYNLHTLGYLPIAVRSLPEGTLVPLRVPYLTIHNTVKDEFFWVTNNLESLMSCEMWQAPTSATIAYGLRKILDDAAMRTVGSTDFVPFQGHDFSMRGMSSLESAISSGMGHLLSFVGTDTAPAILGAIHYYGADLSKELIGTSIPATEHSVQCAYADDVQYIKEMITRVHPAGYVSIVCDGYDYWHVIKNILPELKDIIMARDGKVVIRPDSGDPVEIVCGNDSKLLNSVEQKGSVEALWDIFGGTTSPQGYKILDSHIGLIYGDSITPTRAQQIVDGLAQKGFASINCVFGVGSYTYQYNTRDTFGFAMKSTYCKVNGEDRQIFKDPKTDDGTKKSQKGMVAVVRSADGRSYECVDGLSPNDTCPDDQLRLIYKNGEFFNQDTFQQIRERLRAQ
jgi:nicotinamide phosphoribosyltransferase